VKHNIRALLDQSRRFTGDRQVTLLNIDWKLGALRDQGRHDIVKCQRVNLTAAYLAIGSQTFDQLSPNHSGAANNQYVHPIFPYNGATI
jgi:hypothetical protein